MARERDIHEVHKRVTAIARKVRRDPKASRAAKSVAARALSIRINKK